MLNVDCSYGLFVALFSGLEASRALGAGKADVLRSLLCVLL